MIERKKDVSLNYEKLMAMNFESRASRVGQVSKVPKKLPRRKCTRLYVKCPEVHKNNAINTCGLKKNFWVFFDGDS